MTESELLVSIARKIIDMEDWFDPDPCGDERPWVRIDGWVETFTDEEIALIRSMRAESMARALSEITDAG